MDTSTSHGFLSVDKPAGITSHDVVQAIRRITGIKKVGHAGTLDPFATGLLVVGVGREATRKLGIFLGQDKEYEALMQLGAVSDTQDLDGQVAPTDGELPKPEDLLKIMERFRGEIKQIPPMHSAKKVGGRKLYELARAGQTIERQPVSITIHELELLSYEPPQAKFRVRCSSGTYVRTLAHDIGQALGCGAHLTELRRTSIGPISLKTAHQLEKITTENWINLLWQPPKMT